MPDAADSVHSLVSIGHTLQSQGQNAEALHCFESTLDLDPRCTPAWISLADLLVQEGHPQLALECYLRALEIEPDNLLARNNLADLLRQNGQHAEADSLLELVAAPIQCAPLSTGS
jgi:tetratricopeptide (TPR) repeat protein